VTDKDEGTKSFGRWYSLLRFTNQLRDSASVVHQDGEKSTRRHWQRHFADLI
jgi:hypothetical protein